MYPRLSVPSPPGGAQTNQASVSVSASTSMHQRHTVLWFLKILEFSSPEWCRRTIFRDVPPQQLPAYRNGICSFESTLPLCTYRYKSFVSRLVRHSHSADAVFMLVFMQSSCKLNARRGFGPTIARQATRNLILKPLPANSKVPPTRRVILSAAALSAVLLTSAGELSKAAWSTPNAAFPHFSPSANVE